jgi:hypothetical protein
MNTADCLFVLASTARRQRGYGELIMRGGVKRTWQRSRKSEAARRNLNFNILPPSPNSSFISSRHKLE